MNALAHWAHPNIHSHHRNEPVAKNRLRLLSYNIQAAVASTRPHHYFTQGWKHVLPHLGSFDNLDRIAHLVSDYDVVALQEVDAGSLRSYFINQVEYLAKRGHFPFWSCQTNRKLGKFAQHSNGLLSRIQPHEVIEHKLPGLIPGRGLMMVRYGHSDNPLVVLLAHLALSKRARFQQLDFIREIVNQYQHVVLMGDLNCQPQSEEMYTFLESTHLCEPLEELHTFPSWRPLRNIDHILVTPSLKVSNIQVLNHAISDHLPIALEIAVPEGVHLAG
ncbi:MAG: endonuclease/exonuclease/phosphatase family protein [Gammaproteobacteria bacterium]|nr:endonuclease/exonuclease/phosphatase family protein [Gammaproteobacteria bacterium]